MSAPRPLCWPGLETELCSALGLVRPESGFGALPGASPLASPAPTVLHLGQPLTRLLCPEVFAAAWRRVRSPGGAGVDGVNRVRFERDLEGNLARIRSRVLQGTWRPLPLLRRRIAKPGGGERVLGIPTLADRLVQAAVLEAVGPRIDALFLPWVFGYRPGRGVDQALARLARAIGTRPHVELLKVDVEGLFDNLDHRFLERCLSATWSDGLWLELNRSWRRHWSSGPGRGVPQGAPLSPLLANLYLHHALDLPLEREACGRGAASLSLVARLRYADDIVLATEARGGLVAVLRWVEGTLSRAELSLSPAKTAVRSAGTEPVPVVILGQQAALARTAAGWSLRMEATSSASPAPWSAEEW